jgi:hypothetical protein
MRFWIWQSKEIVKIVESCYYPSSLQLLIYAKKIETLRMCQRIIWVFKKLQSRTWEYYLIWIMSLMGHLQFLCCNWNYPFIHFILGIICLYLHVIKRGYKWCYLSPIETTLEEYKADMTSGSLKVFCLSTFGGLQSLMHIFSFPSFQMLSYLFFQDQNLILYYKFNLWFCTLEYILAYTIVI